MNSNTAIRKALYWLATGLAALIIVATGAANLMRAPQLLAGLAHLGYPLVLSSILGVWQLLGAAAILAPGLARLKEWAYAGFVFLLTGAAASHASAGDSIGHIMFPLVLLGLVVSSYVLKPARDAIARRNTTASRAA